ncbi:MAG: DEAD/DEAH box helicase [Fimbriimonadaceae bacterium]|nr:DEAD/DEAH box helicase [Fimbriimonadaceae bacterium]
MLETKNPNGFRGFALSSPLNAHIARLGIHTPTPIQDAAIPLALAGHDLIGIAQTGTGKTLAFALPMAMNLKKGSFGIVLAPTRELAVQIEETFAKLQVKTALVIGGVPMHRQVRELRAHPTVIIATPGRLMDHMRSKTVSLSRCAIAVLDEADRMLDMGFAPAIRTILEATPSARQTMMFSATMPKNVVELAESYLIDPERVEVAAPGTPVELIEQEVVVVHKEFKATVLQNVLRENKGSILVFARTRHGARKIAKNIRALEHTACEIHSDRTQAQRKEALHGFKIGKYRVLVATDIAARGIDVKDISLVLNYDVPENPEDYLHRIGRTGRAGAKGRAITLATPEQQKDVSDIERLMQVKIPVNQAGSAKFSASAEPKAFPARQARRNAIANNRRRKPR